MKRKNKAIPFHLGKIHLDPERKTVLLGASFVRAERPKYVSARLAVPLGEAPLWAMPAFVDVRSRVLAAYGTACNWYTFDALLTRHDLVPGATEKGRLRYQRFVTELLKAGYAIEWQTPPGLHYGDRASFERALNPAVTKPLAYAEAS